MTYIQFLAILALFAEKSNIKKLGCNSSNILNKTIKVINLVIISIVAFK